MNLETKHDLYGDIGNNLKTELELLTVKIKECRETGNYGTYKNLIQAYKDILHLYIEIINSDNNNFNHLLIQEIPNIVTTEEFDEMDDNLKRILKAININIISIPQI